MRYFRYPCLSGSMEVREVVSLPLRVSSATPNGEKEARAGFYLEDSAVVNDVTSLKIHGDKGCSNLVIRCLASQILKVKKTYLKETVFKI